MQASGGRSSREEQPRMIWPRCLDEDWSLFAIALALSAAMHSPMFRPINLSGWSKPRVSEIELDITRGETVGLPLLGRRGAVSSRATAAKSTPEEWTLHGDKEGERPAAPPASAASSGRSDISTAPRDESAGDATGGSGGAVQFSHLPHLKNLRELKSILEKYYPESERRLRRQAKVVLDLHIDAQGNVTDADIVQSGGPSFDQAAREAGRRLRYSPAYVGVRPVPVKLRQAIEFKLK